MLDNSSWRAIDIYNNLGMILEDYIVTSVIIVTSVAVSQINALAEKHKTRLKTTVHGLTRLAVQSHETGILASSTMPAGSGVCGVTKLLELSDSRPCPGWNVGESAQPGLVVKGDTPRRLNLFS